MTTHVNILRVRSLALLACLVLYACVDHEVDPDFCGLCLPDGSAAVDAQVATDAWVGDASSAADSGKHDAAWADAMTVGDAAQDATTLADAESDATVSACVQTCQAAKPVCDEATGQCVECVEKSDCANASEPACDGDSHACVECMEKSDCKNAGEPACDEDSHACVECVASADCGNPAEARCNTGTNTCGSCQGSGDCGHLAGKPACSGGICVECTSATQGADCTDPAKPACDDNTKSCVECTATSQAACGGSTPICDVTRHVCVECTGATEAARCGANSCKRSTGTCTGTPRTSLNACAKCEADSECKSGLKCVMHMFGNQQVGTYCSFDASGGCADTDPGRQPYSRTVSLTSIDGVDGDYCLPPAATTCKGIADATDWNRLGGGAKACASNGDCGEPGISDGTCADSGAAIGKCSYNCNHGYECPSIGFTNCPAMPSFCQP